MRELLNQDRALSATTIRLATNVLGLLLAVAATIISLFGLITIFVDKDPLAGLLQITGGAGVLLGLFLIVRLQAEALRAAQRSNDRLMILTDALIPRQASDISIALPAKKSAAPVKAPAVKAHAQKVKPAKTSPAPSDADT